MFKPVYYSILVYVVQFSLRSHCTENNVCPTIKDYYTIKDNPNCYYDFSADADVVTIIAYSGYPVETHKVITPDGYILTMFRITNNRAETTTSTKGPVFLQHGWLNSAANFVGLGKDSLAFVLADAGYDVWLGNLRGTEYSEEHVNLTVYDKQYWDYSVDELGLYDMPAQLEYVAQITGQKGDIVYIGHSLGTTTGLFYSSTFPKGASKTIKLFILLAPVAKIPNTKSPLIRFLKSVDGLLLKIVKENDLIRLVSQSKIMKTVTRQLCLESPLLMRRCIDILDLLFSGPQAQMDAKTIPVYLNQAPAGSSLKIGPQILDFVKNNFRRNDYGLKNVEIYGTDEPPPYDLSKIEVPIYLMYAVNDWVATPKDSRNLHNSLPAEIRHGKHEIKVPNFNHFDFLYGRNAKSIVYDIILEVLSSVE